MGVSIRDVAKACGVSTYTVSSVINDKGRISDATRQRVLSIIQDMGYDANRNAPHRRRLTHCIGLVMPFGDAPSSSFYFRALSSAKAATIGTRLELVVYSENEIDEMLNDPECTQTIQADSLIFFAPKIKKWNALARKLVDMDIPVAVIRRQCNINGVLSVCDDDHAAIYRATEHLIQQGHRYIAFLNFGRGKNPLAADRLKGYQDALTDNNIPNLEELIMSSGGGGKAIADLLRNHLVDEIIRLRSQHMPVSAIVLPNDGLVGHVMGALQEAGLKVPRDIAIVGYGNEPICTQLYPQITAVNMPIEEMVKHAVERLSKKDNQAIKTYVFENELIKREST